MVDLDSQAHQAHLVTLELQDLRVFQEHQELQVILEVPDLLDQLANPALLVLLVTQENLGQLAHLEHPDPLFPPVLLDLQVFPVLLA